MPEGNPVTGPGADRGMVFQSYTLFRGSPSGRMSALGFAKRRAGKAGVTVDSYIDKVGPRGFEDHWPKQLRAACTAYGDGVRAPPTTQRSYFSTSRSARSDNQTRGLMQELLLGIWERGATHSHLRHPRH